MTSNEQEDPNKRWRAMVLERLSFNTDSIQKSLNSSIAKAFDEGVASGRMIELQNTIKRLKEYEADSAVAKLLAELMKREFDERYV